VSSLGKIDGLEADNNAFAHDWRTQFLNLGLTLNMTAAVAPISAWGGGVAVLPWKGAQVSVSVLDPNKRNRDHKILFGTGTAVLSRAPRQTIHGRADPEEGLQHR
jgi:hypothetical protein